MKIWYNKDKLNLQEFIQEKFLFLPLYSKEVIDQSNDFKNNDWSNKIKDIVEYTSIDDADYLVYHDKFDQGILEYTQYSNRKPILAFFNDDSCKSISDELPKNVYVFRTSINKSRQKQNELALPAWSNDFKCSKYYPSIDEPVISFCGAITDPVRSKCIQQLESNTDLKTNFIIRNAFWGGSIHNATLRQEYINNIQKSHMVLCCRGAGNFSYRLYETLSCGRIPVIVDTDLSLPCADKIWWDDFIITTPETINKDINEWWSKHDPKNLKKLFKYSRFVYDKFLTPAGFASYINNYKGIV